jgi:biotin transporter BioY
MTEQAPPAAQTGTSPWVVIGWVCAIAFPLAGFVIGFFLPRRYSRQGFRIMVVSLVVGLVRFALVR